MRCVIARYPFDLSKADVETSMERIRPEPVTGVCVVISGRVYPVKQVGQVVTGQNRCDFTIGEMTRALTRLGFTCHATPPHIPSRTGAAYRPAVRP